MNQATANLSDPIATANLSDMQKKYVWLAGSYPSRVLTQGRGRRSPRLLYALNLPDEIVVFGYSNPMIWLVNRGLFRKLQGHQMYTLTDEGEACFRRLLVSGAGMKINDGIEEVRASERGGQ